MNRALIAAIIVVVAIAALAAAVLTSTAPEPAPAPAASTPAPAAPEGRFVALSGADFSTVAPVDGKGQPADMAPYRGKALLVNLWATWCAPCIQELPSLGKLQQDLGGDKFQVVTIAIDERDPAKIEPFLAAHGAGNLPTLIDLNRTIDTVAQVSALPTSLLVDSDGKVKAMLSGDARWNCGKALEAVKAFVADGTVNQDVLDPCE
ncbi:MAG TPA: TlpA disulfide reductase family protein [Dongiaceae bacterium]|jgi:thiol-disulfide isomerase/thioredoxin|nr:TlpA disulfide reductase family protein [Dongiaceae bacterium]